MKVSPRQVLWALGFAGLDALTARLRIPEVGSSGRERYARPQAEWSDGTQTRSGADLDRPCACAGRFGLRWERRTQALGSGRSGHRGSLALGAPPLAALDAERAQRDLDHPRDRRVDGAPEGHAFADLGQARRPDGDARGLRLGGAEARASSRAVHDVAPPRPSSRARRSIGPMRSLRARLSTFGAGRA